MARDRPTLRPDPRPHLLEAIASTAEASRQRPGQHLLSIELKHWRDRMGVVHARKGLVQCSGCMEWTPDLVRHAHSCTNPPR
jgi:hypothetical protein